ncbi:MAG: WD40 repeat domain-containing protein, partial [Pyrinomonadaceae bacterium]
MSALHKMNTIALSVLLRTLSLAVLTAATAMVMAAQSNGVEYRSYLAHIAAASNALRVNETGEAKRWIDAAPVKYRGWEWAFLNARANQYTASRSVHALAVTSISMSPDGRRIASSSTDRTVKVTDAITGAELFSFSDPDLSPQSVAFSPDGKYLAAAFSRHTVIVWDLASKAENRRLQGQGKGITAVTFSPDGSLIASCSWNVTPARGVWGIVEVWNASSGAPVKQLEYGVKPLVGIAFSPDGKHLAVASWEVDKVAAVWSTTKWGAPLV